MNIHNINDKMVVVPTRIEDIEALKAIESQIIIIDFIDEQPHCAVIGCLMELEKSGKDIIVMHRGGFIGGILRYLTSVKVA